MKQLTYLLMAFMLVTKVYAQTVIINPDGITPKVGAYPRTTYDSIQALPSPKSGDQAYDLTYECMRFYSAGKWVCSFQDPLKYTPNMAAITSAGGTISDNGKSIAFDSNGNFYITGYYSGTATFGLTPITSKGNNDIFIAKYNGSGILQWVQSGGGTSDDGGLNIAVDASNNVYITGYYSGIATFDITTITSQGGNDVFLAKYNTNGTFAWVKSAGGTSVDSGVGLALDSDDNIFLTGNYTGTANFDLTSKTSEGNKDIFLAKYDSSGNVVWVESAGGTDEDIVSGIVTDNTNNIYLTGNYKGTVIFGPLPRPSQGNADIFIVKYDISTLNWSWLKSAGGTANDFAGDIAISPTGYLFITGWYSGTATFGSTTPITSQGMSDIFVASYNNTGGFQLVKSAGGSGADFGYGIAVDAYGNAYASGSYLGTATFGSTSITSLGSDDIFVAKYNGSSILQSVHSAGGTGIDTSYSIEVDSKNNVYGIGNYTGIGTFGRNTKTSQGSSDIFVLRFDK